MEAMDVNCSGCIDLTNLDVGVLNAANIGFDDTTAQLGATNVQSALEKLKALLDTGVEATNVNEGAGSVSRYTNQWGLPSYGTAVEYIHLMNPAPAKVLLHLYAEDATGFAGSNNLIVSNTYDPTSI